MLFWIENFATPEDVVDEEETTRAQHRDKEVVEESGGAFFGIDKGEVDRRRRILSRELGIPFGEKNLGVAKM